MLQRRYHCDNIIIIVIFMIIIIKESLLITLLLAHCAGHFEAVARHGEPSPEGHRESSLRALFARSRSFRQPDHLQGRRHQVEKVHIQRCTHNFTTSLHAQRNR